MNIKYLTNPDPQISLQYCSEKKRVLHILDSYKIWSRLNLFTPYISGTFPINIQTKTSDLDVLCYYKEPKEFEEEIKKQFSDISGLSLEKGSTRGQACITCRLHLDGLPIEIFAQDRSVPEQDAFRHMIIEAQLLNLGGNIIREKIMSLKANGIKTEPAFAQVFGLKNDPYVALLKLEKQSEAYKAQLVKNTFLK